MFQFYGDDGKSWTSTHLCWTLISTLQSWAASQTLFATCLTHEWYSSTDYIRTYLNLQAIHIDLTNWDFLLNQTDSFLLFHNKGPTGSLNVNLKIVVVLKALKTNSYISKVIQLLNAPFASNKPIIQLICSIHSHKYFGNHLSTLRRKL